MKSGDCAIKWDGRDPGANEINHHWPEAGLHPKKVTYVRWDWKGVLYYKLFPEKQMINSPKYCSQLDDWKQHSTKASWMSRQKTYHLLSGPHKAAAFSDDCAARLRSSIHLVHQTLHLQMSFPSGLYDILLMETISVPWKTVKGTWSSSLLKKIKCEDLWEDRSEKLPEKWQDVTEQNSEYMVQ